MAHRPSRRPTWLVGIATGAVISSATIAALLTNSNAATGLPQSLQVGRGVVVQRPNVLSNLAAKRVSSVRVPTTSSARQAATSTSHEMTSAPVTSRVVTVQTVQPVADSGNSNSDGSSQGASHTTSSKTPIPTSNGDN